MKDLRKVVVTFLLAVLLLPLGFSFAQEEDPTLYQALPGEEDTVTIQEGDSRIYESEILVEDSDYDYDYGSLYEEMDAIEDPAATATIIAFFAAYAFFFFLFFVAGYVFSAIALQKIAKEMGYENHWFAWIPILNTVMIFELGGQNPLILFLTLIPILGIFIVAIFGLVALMNITEKRGYDKVLALITMSGIGAYILLYLLAWRAKDGGEKALE